MTGRCPSAGWRGVRQVMAHIRPRNGQERAVLKRLRGCDSLSIQRLRSTVTTREESLYATLSRLEDKGLVYASSARSIELTEDGLATLELLRETEVSAGD